MTNRDVRDVMAEIRAIHHDRLKDAKDISGQAAEAHKEVLSIINELLQGEPLERRVLESPSFEFVGGLVRIENQYDMGIPHILVRSDVAAFDSSNETYISTKDYNPDKSITPKDFFIYVVAHEYGHIILSERFTNRLRKNYTDSEGNDCISRISIEADEAFGYWFGDTISGIRSNLRAFPDVYQGIDFTKIVTLYDELDDLSKKSGNEAVLDVENLKRIFLKHDAYESIMAELSERLGELHPDGRWGFDIESPLQRRVREMAVMIHVADRELTRNQMQEVYLSMYGYIDSHWGMSKACQAAVKHDIFLRSPHYVNIRYTLNPEIQLEPNTYVPEWMYNHIVHFLNQQNQENANT